MTTLQLYSEKCSVERKGEDMRTLRTVFCVTLICMIELMAQPAFSSPQQAGVIEEIHSEFIPTQTLMESQVHWTWRYQHPGSQFLQVHFGEIADTAMSRYTVLVRDIDYKVIESYSSEEFALSADLWTGLISGDAVVIEVVGPDIVTGLRFKVVNVAYQADGGRTLSITDPDQRQPVYEFKNRPEIYLNSRPVARIAYWKGTNVWFCTGFMIGIDAMMTNHHCIGDDLTCKSAIIWFGYEEEQSGVFSHKTDQAKCLSVKSSSSTLDYSTLRISGDFGRPDRWGSLAMISWVPSASPSKDLYLIHHPAGEAKQVSIADCSVSTPLAKGTGPDFTEFGHSCDTLTGSSGSPIFNSAHQLVGLHHVGMCKVGRWRNENRAVLGKWILERLNSPENEVQLAKDECSQD